VNEMMGLGPVEQDGVAAGERRMKKPVGQVERTAIVSLYAAGDAPQPSGGRGWTAGKPRHAEACAPTTLKLPPDYTDQLEIRARCRGMRRRPGRPSSPRFQRVHG
jgi:hypothetical protein